MTGIVARFMGYCQSGRQKAAGKTSALKVLYGKARADRNPEALPLTHPVRVARSVSLGIENPLLWLDLAYMVVFIVVVGWIAINRLEKRLID